MFRAPAEFVRQGVNRKLLAVLSEDSPLLKERYDLGGFLAYPQVEEWEWRVLEVRLVDFAVLLLSEGLRDCWS